MRYVVCAFSEDRVGVRIAVFLSNCFAALGRESKFLVVKTKRARDTEGALASAGAFGPDDAVVSLNYPRMAYGHAFNAVRRFIVWRHQSFMDWELMPEVRQSFVERQDFAFGYCESLRQAGFPDSLLCESIFAVPVCDMLPYAAGGKNSLPHIALVSSRGGGALAFLQSKEGVLAARAAGLASMPHEFYQLACFLDYTQEWPNQAYSRMLEAAATPEARMFIEWEVGERAYRHAAWRFLRSGIGEMLQAAGSGWDGGLGPVAMPRSAQLYSDSRCGLHASLQTGWHHRMAEILMCGGIPIAPSWTSHCAPWEPGLAAEWKWRYLEGFRLQMRSFADAIDGGAAPMGVPIPPSPCALYDGIPGLKAAAVSLLREPWERCGFSWT